MVVGPLNNSGGMMAVIWTQNLFCLGRKRLFGEIVGMTLGGLSALEELVLCLWKFLELVYF
jgi:hypothetical protein